MSAVQENRVSATDNLLIIILNFAGQCRMYLWNRRNSLLSLSILLRCCITNYVARLVVQSIVVSSINSPSSWIFLFLLWRCQNKNEFFFVFRVRAVIATPKQKSDAPTAICIFFYSSALIQKDQQIKSPFFVCSCLYMFLFIDLNIRLQSFVFSCIQICRVQWIWKMMRNPRDVAARNHV